MPSIALFLCAYKFLQLKKKLEIDVTSFSETGKKQD